MMYNSGVSLNGSANFFLLDYKYNTGPLYIGNATSVIIDSALFEENHNTALKLEYANNVLIENSIFRQNTDASSGGGLNFTNVDSARVTKVFAELNVATDGGFASFNSSSNVTVDSLIAFDNHANQEGGAIYIFNTDVYINKSNILFNSTLEDLFGSFFISWTNSFYFSIPR